MDEESLISVIVPVYNGERYIESCLENIMAQTYKNLEIIVVIDGAIDRSEEIARKYPVKLILHESNLGLSAARNTGLDAANGEYIHFLDVDDGINLDYYREMVASITETGSDIACGGMFNEKHYYKTQLFKKREVYTLMQDKLKITYVGRWGYVWRYLFRADFLKRYNLRFEEGRFIEDLMFSLPAVYYADKLVVVPNAEYFYNYRENSIMTNKDKTHREKRKQDWLHVIELRQKFSVNNKIRIPGVHTGKITYTTRKIFLSVIKWQNPF